MLDGLRALEPPDPIPNSAVKRSIADGSVGPPHVRVGHRQALIRNPQSFKKWLGFFYFALWQKCLGTSRFHPENNTNAPKATKDQNFNSVTTDTLYQ